MNRDDHLSQTLSMTASTVGRDLLQGLVQEIKLLPNLWQKLPKAKQEDVLKRLRERVDDNVRMAVHLIAADSRTVVSGVLEQITIKNGSKAVVTIAKGDPHQQALYGAAGKQVLLVVADARDHTGGMDGVKGDSDQPGLDLGGEDSGPGSDQGAGAGDGVKGDSDRKGDITDAEYRDLPALTDGPTQAQIDEHRELGRGAAKAGRPQSDCPMVHGTLCIAWVEGWKSWHEDNPRHVTAADVDDGNSQPPAGAGQDQQERGESAGNAGAAGAPAGEAEDEFFTQARAAVVKERRASVSFLQRALKVGYHRAAKLLDLLEAAGVISPPATNGVRTVLWTQDQDGVQ